jgi:hypothetical protein
VRETNETFVVVVGEGKTEADSDRPSTAKSTQVMIFIVYGAPDSHNNYYSTNLITRRSVREGIITCPNGDHYSLVSKWLLSLLVATLSFRAHEIIQYECGMS